MDEDAHAFAALVVADAILLGADAAHRDRVDVFQVAGVEAERNVQLRAVGGEPIAAGAEVIFHIAAAAVPIGIRVVELAEDIGRALAADVGQHVEPAAVGHRHHDFDHAVFGGGFKREVQQRNERFGPFQRKRRRAEVLLADELFEDHGVGQPRENAELDLARRRTVDVVGFDPLLDPFADVALGDVHVLETDVVASRCGSSDRSGRGAASVASRGRRRWS